jgi:hypothetical protein
VTKTLFVALSLSLAACGGAVSSIEMKGGDTDVASLAGEWEGSYTGIETGRSGPVKFSLTLGRHTANGTVLMDGTPLQVEFVSVEDGSIAGKMDPYQEPSCTCQVQTEFTGTVIGDAITGSYTTTVVGAPDKQMHGEWSVARKLDS